MIKTIDHLDFILKLSGTQEPDEALSWLIEEFFRLKIKDLTSKKNILKSKPMARYGFG